MNADEPLDIPARDPRVRRMGPPPESTRSVAVRLCIAFALLSALSTWFWLTGNFANTGLFDITAAGRRQCVLMAIGGPLWLASADADSIGELAVWSCILALFLAPIALALWRPKIRILRWFAMIAVFGWQFVGCVIPMNQI